ncbi:M23 family metallopeptidase [Candidatus Shapirobacteria bacterium]|nr:M23 family metallopeptidase [Candidatus Shapirobacteria bacterium]
MTQQQRKEYQKIQNYIWALQQKTWLLEGISKQLAYAEVVKVAQILGITDFSALSRKIFELLSVPPEQPAPNLPPSEILKADIESEIREKQERKLNLIYPTLNEQIKKLQKRYAQKISAQLVKEEPLLAQNPPLREFISQEASFKLANDLPQVAQPQIFNEVEYQEVIEKNKTYLADEFQKIGLEPTKITTDQNFSQRFRTTTFETSQTIAATPHNTVAIEKIIEIRKPTLKAEEIPPLSREIFNELNQPEETIVFPAAYLLHPKTAAAVAQKVIFTPQANLLKMAIENAPPDWQEDPKYPILKEIVHNRIFTEDIQATITFLKEKGLKDDHPLIQRLQKKFFDFEAVQKNPKTGRDLPWVKTLKRTSFIDDLLGKRKAFDQDLQGYWISARKPLWDKQGSFGDLLHRGLDKFRFVTNTSQRVMKFATRGRYSSFGIFVRRVVYQKALRPIFVRLGKTATGKAVKAGVKKLSTWLAVKLGIQLGSKAVAAAAAPETAGISLLISLAIDALLFIKNMIFKGINFLKRAWFEMSEDPEKAVTYLILGGAILIPVLIPGFLVFAPILAPVLTIIGAPLALSGGAALLTSGLKAASLGSAATALSTQTAMAAATTGGHVVLGSVMGVGVGALIVTQITASAFIIPESEEFAGSPYIELNKTSEVNVDEGTGEGTITYQISVGAQDENLTEVKISDKISTRCVNDEAEIKKGSLGSPPNVINNGSSWNTSYTVEVKGVMDCLIINTVNVLAKIESQPEEIQEKTITHVIKIGNPPDDCPYGWPTSGTINGLPGDPRPGHKHAGIDIGNEIYTPIHGTHGGSVLSGYTSTKGNYVEIVGACGSQVFRTVYYHLSKISISSGEVIGCRQIGEMGSTGNSTGPHLHYEIQGLGDNWWTSGEYFPYPERGSWVSDSCL